ncbi:hypothetical protein FJM67_12030 [Maribrevibacterium harenarium]|uniref:tRNA 2-thiouridine synthesizing protein B n=2 Tax=Maribrevibacterium harenarium TaxID=2589817 RepID=A0A501WLM6_9GAMM|nr:hypothetical protein FJM67_12030 [Maribrevibacterium harenarium]
MFYGFNMATLHTLNKAEYPAAVERDWRCAVKPGDTILLIEEAVLRLLNPEAINQLSGANLTARQADLQAYGLQPPSVCDDTAWVELCVSHDKLINW